MNDIYKEMIEIYFELKGTPESSIESYYRRVEAFVDFFEERKINVENITTQHIQRYILFLKNQRNLSAGTINNYISGIKCFWIHCLGKEWDKSRLPRMKRVEKMPLIPAQEDVFRLIDSVVNLKHRAILQILFGSGLRVGEVAKLKIGDICSKSMKIRVDEAKHNTNRYSILPERALKSLREYFKVYFKGKEYSSSDWLFPGQKPQRHISTKSIKNTIIKLRNKLDMDTRISAHTLRHAFAVYMLENKVDPVIIQYLLGHKSITTTTKYYLHLTSKSLMGIKSPLDTYDKGGDINDYSSTSI